MKFGSNLSAWKRNPQVRQSHDHTAYPDGAWACQTALTRRV